MKIPPQLLIAIIFLTGCCPDKMLNPEYINEFHQTYFGDKKTPLKTGEVRLFVDYSTCVFQAKNDGSTFYNDMLNIMQEATSYYSIKGDIISLEESIKTSTDIYNELAKNLPDIPYADLSKAAEMIVNGDCEAILVTDGELYEPNDAKGHENDAYLSKAFKKWLGLGREIFIYSEPYIEKYKGQQYDKKRFYFVFTDSEMKGNVYNKIMEQIPNIEKRSDVLQYHLTSSHSILNTETQSNSSDPNENLSAKILDACGYYEVQDWREFRWKDIKKYIIDAEDDETGNQLKNGEAVISGLCLDRNTKGSCFRIDDIYLEVSNLTELYQQYCDAKDGGQKPSQIMKEHPMSNNNNYRMEDFLIFDKEEFKRTGKIILFFDKENFDPTNLQSNSDNLLKIDVKVKNYSNVFRNNSEAHSIVEFDALGKNGQKNLSVAKSIESVLADQKIRDMMQDRTLYTIYVFSLSL